MILVWRRRKHRRVGRCSNYYDLWKVCTHSCQKHCWSYPPFGNNTACQIEPKHQKLSFLMNDQKDSNLPSRYLSQLRSGNFGSCRLLNISWVHTGLLPFLTQLSKDMKGHFLSILQYLKRRLWEPSLERHWVAQKVSEAQM